MKKLLKYVIIGSLALGISSGCTTFSHENMRQKFFTRLNQTTYEKILTPKGFYRHNLYERAERGEELTPEETNEIRDLVLDITKKSGITTFKELLNLEESKKPKNKINLNLKPIFEESLEARADINYILSQAENSRKSINLYGTTNNEYGVRFNSTNDNFWFGIGIEKNRSYTGKIIFLQRF